MKYWKTNWLTDRRTSNWITLVWYMTLGGISIFYIHGSVHRESYLIIVLQDATVFSLLYRFRQINLAIFKSQYNEKYTIFLREFITKIIFISKHFNYNIHFLNIVSVRWRPLLSAHSHKRRTSDKSLTQTFDVLRSSKWSLSSWTFTFCGRRGVSEVSHPQQYSIATRDTVVPINIEVLTKYLLSHKDRIVVLEIRLHSESPML